MNFFFFNVLLQLNHGIEEPFVYNTYTNIDRKYPIPLRTSSFMIDRLTTMRRCGSPLVCVQVIKFQGLLV